MQVSISHLGRRFGGRFTRTGHATGRSIRTGHVTGRFTRTGHATGRFTRTGHATGRFGRTGRASSTRRAGAALGATLALIAFTAAPAFACGGLIGPNGAVNLLRTTTLAGYHNGAEHYVTAFQFAGGGGAFGSLTPLPGIPSSVEKGGDWTLQRLVRETDPQPVFPEALAAAASRDAGAAEELMKVKIDALDVTVLRGGSQAVGQWATDHGFRLPPDAPQVLDFYAERSPIFLAAVFDADAAAQRGQAIGDGTPVHITIPIDNPWVPLRILALGKTATERVDASVYLLTDQRPALLPVPNDANGLRLDHFAPATPSLLDDLRSDRSMGWVPTAAWLTKVGIEASAPDLTFDLAIDASGANAPSRIMAGLDRPNVPAPIAPDQTLNNVRLILGVLLTVGGIGGIILLARPKPPMRMAG